MDVPPREGRGVRPYGAEVAPRSRAKGASPPIRVTILDADRYGARCPSTTFLGIMGVLAADARKLAVPTHPIDADHDNDDLPPALQACHRARSSQDQALAGA